MIAPSGACARAPAKTSQARIFTPRPSPGVSSPPAASASVARTVTDATARFENSTSEWYPRSGKNTFGWQPGQCSQPRPDPVSRTVAPVATTTRSIPVAASASRRKRSGESSRERRRGSVRGADSTCTRRV